jgi:hypothetical protein
MESQFFKTTEQQRNASETTRVNRDLLRKPEPKEVDEALSLAVRKAVLSLKEKGNPETTLASVLDRLFVIAERHLVSVRHMDPVQARLAIDERVEKPRRYRSVSRLKRAKTG